MKYLRKALSIDSAYSKWSINVMYWLVLLCNGSLPKTQRLKILSSILLLMNLHVSFFFFLGDQSGAKEKSSVSKGPVH